MNRKLASLLALGIALLAAAYILHRRSAPPEGIPHAVMRDTAAEMPALKMVSAAATPMIATEVKQQLANLGYLAGGAAKSAAPAPAAEAPPKPAEDSAPNPTSPQYIIRNARVAIEVGDVRKTAAQISDSVKTANGYLSNMNEMTGPLGESNIAMEIRLPAASLDTVLKQLDGLGKVLSRAVTAQDVSQEYIDTDARSRNLKKTEERLLDHLSRSATLENTLKLEAELTRLREQIEVMDGRLRYLDNKVSFCTLQITLSPTPTAQPIAPPDTFSSAREFTNAARDVVTFAQVQWARAIWLGVWGIVWVPLALVALWATRKFVRACIFKSMARMLPVQASAQQPNLP